jgi:hypothetical protein
VICSIHLKVGNLLKEAAKTKDASKAEVFRLKRSLVLRFLVNKYAYAPRRRLTVVKKKRRNVLLKSIAKLFEVFA